MIWSKVRRIRQDDQVKPLAAHSNWSFEVKLAAPLPNWWLTADEWKYLWRKCGVWCLVFPPFSCFHPSAHLPSLPPFSLSAFPPKWDLLKTVLEPPPPPPLSLSLFLSLPLHLRAAHRAAPPCLVSVATWAVPWLAGALRGAAARGTVSLQTRRSVSETKTRGVLPDAVPQGPSAGEGEDGLSVCLAAGQLSATHSPSVGRAHCCHMLNTLRTARMTFSFKI